jgi:hypothetical protein
MALRVMGLALLYALILLLAPVDAEGSAVSATYLHSLSRQAAPANSPRSLPP